MEDSQFEETIIEEAEVQKDAYDTSLLGKVEGHKVDPSYREFSVSAPMKQGTYITY